MLQRADLGSARNDNDESCDHLRVVVFSKGKKCASLKFMLKI